MHIPNLQAICDVCHVPAHTTGVGQAHTTYSIWWLCALIMMVRSYRFFLFNMVLTVNQCFSFLHSDQSVTLHLQVEKIIAKAGQPWYKFFLFTMILTVKYCFSFSNKK
jgi:hypothetical protein